MFDTRMAGCCRMALIDLSKRHDAGRDCARGTGAQTTSASTRQSWREKELAETGVVQVDVCVAQWLRATHTLLGDPHVSTKSRFMRQESRAEYTMLRLLAIISPVAAAVAYTPTLMTNARHIISISICAGRVETLIGHRTSILAHYERSQANYGKFLVK